MAALDVPPPPNYPFPIRAEVIELGVEPTQWLEDSGVTAGVLFEATRRSTAQLTVQEQTELRTEAGHDSMIGVWLNPCMGICPISDRDEGDMLRLFGTLYHHGNDPFRRCD